MKGFFVTLGLVVLLVREFVQGEGGATGKAEHELTAEELLHTIAPTYRLAKVPPGFPPLDEMNTDKFNYKTGGRYIKVVAKLNSTVKMVKDYVELSDVKMNFTYDKRQPVNGTWKFQGNGVITLGSSSVDVTISEKGEINGNMTSVTFEDILKTFSSQETLNTLEFDSSEVELENVTLSGMVQERDGFFYLLFKGLLKWKSTSTATASITVTKATEGKLKAYAILEFKNMAPGTVLNDVVDDETSNVPFFNKLVSDSILLSKNKTQFGISLSLTDVYNLTYHTVTGEIIRDVLQSHIPGGVTLLCPVNFSDEEDVDPIKLAFVVKRPNFDLLIDKHDKIALQRILETLSSELTPPSLPVFLKRTKKAFTSHISYESETKLFSIFVHLKDEVGLAPGVLRSNVKSVVLVKNVSKDSSSDDWKLSVKGSLLIGSVKMKMRYAQMGNKPEKVYGMTAVAKSITLEDIIDEFDPEIYASEESKEMIANTEINDFEIDNVSLFSRITRTNTPHLLLTGRTNLPEWEKNIRVSLLLLLDKKQWYMKIALTLVHSALSNVIQALTGFDSSGTSLLHNNNIVTSLVSSPLPSYSYLPPKIITTPLLRLPVNKGITLIALFKFPDNCGDDKICKSAHQLIDAKQAYTFKGSLSLDGFQLEASVLKPINLGNDVEAVNNTLVFSVAKETKLELQTSLKMRDFRFVFDGKFSFLKNGLIQMAMECRKKTWVAPFGLTFLQFKNLTLNSSFNPADTLNWMKLNGTLKLGAIGNGNELEAPLSLDFNPSRTEAGRFYANFSDITISDIMNAFTINFELPYVLRTAVFPNGLMLSYSVFDQSSQSNKAELHGDIKILGRVLSCVVRIIHPSTILIVTSNSPAPVILGNGQIIIVQDADNELRGPRIIARIDHKEANVTMSGYVKALGLESDTNVTLNEDGLAFTIEGKMMEFKETEMTAVSQGSLDAFQVFGCFQEIPEEVELLLTEIIAKASNQSTLNIHKAEQNLLLAEQYFQNADHHEFDVRSEKEDLRKVYEDHLLEYGRAEVKVNDTCKPLSCEVTCFGCPEWSRCCHRDIFGECIRCANWKKCCWKDVDPICIAEDDGCRIIRTVAEAQLTDKQILLDEERLHLDKLEALAIDAEENKGKHKAVLEAAIDAKRLVVEDSGPGLNAADASKNFGEFTEWIKIESVCYNTSLEEVATGCMYFHVKGSFFKGAKSTVSIGSCLKEELVNELAESIANFMFPGIVDTSSDDVTDVKLEPPVISARTPTEPPQLKQDKIEDHSRNEKKVEQDALYQRKRREINMKKHRSNRKKKHHDKKSKISRSKGHEILLENPFWDIRLDNKETKSRSKIPFHPAKKLFMNRMLHKRWRIPENAAGRCHIFHQLIDICKDMAETISLMDRSLTSTVKRYKKEKSLVSGKSASSLDYLAEAAKRLQLNDTSLSAIDQTLQVVNQGIDIWASKCEKELNWQNTVGVQNWLTAMDMRIQELGGFGVYRFLENLFHAFEALFEASSFSDENADEALTLLQRIRKISTGFDRIFRERLPVRTSQMYAKEILHHLGALKHESIFCT